MVSRPALQRRHVRSAVAVLLLALFGVVLALNAHRLAPGLVVLQAVSDVSVLIAVGLTLLTFVIAAFIYTMLALKPLHYGQTLVVEIASAFANRLLPVGLGALGLHGLYLYRKQHSAAQATAVVSVNNLVGIICHFSILALVLLLRPVAIAQFEIAVSPYVFIGLGCVILVIAAVVFVSNGLWARLSSFLHHLGQSFLSYKKRPKRLALAFAGALSLSATYTAILAVCIRAVGIDVQIEQVFVVLSAGMLAASATPTPGGLVGSEAGLFGSLVAYGAPTEQATAAVIFYRLLTYGLPLAPGLVALAYCRKRKLL